MTDHSRRPLEASSRVAVVIPQHRTWRWHEKIIRALERRFAVDVYVSRSAPKYPLILRLWMGVEGWLFGSPRPRIIDEIFGSVMVR